METIMPDRYWVVTRHKVAEELFKTLADAKQSARKKAANHPGVSFVVLETVHHFKVDMVEGTFDEPTSSNSRTFSEPSFLPTSKSRYIGGRRVKYDENGRAITGKELIFRFVWNKPTRAVDMQKYSLDCGFAASSLSADVSEMIRNEELKRDDQGYLHLTERGKVASARYTIPNKQGD
jgi:hypothetical protein